jgi:predicted DNA-binding transcriptional regulator AlpA
MLPSEHQQRKMLKAPAAAAYCGSSASTFAKLRLYGGGPMFLKLGRRVVYHPGDLDRWLAEHRRASTSECAPASPPCLTTSDAQVAGDHCAGEVAPVPRRGRPPKRLQTGNPVVAS